MKEYDTTKDWNAFQYPSDQVIEMCHKAFNAGMLSASTTETQENQIDALVKVKLVDNVWMMFSIRELLLGYFNYKHTWESINFPSFEDIDEDDVKVILK